MGKVYTRAKGQLTGDTRDDLFGEVLDMPSWEGIEAVLLEEVVDTFAQQFGNDADVVLEVKPLEQLDAFAKRGERNEGGMKLGIVVCIRTGPAGAT